MKVVPQKISTITASMAIVNGEEGASRPVVDLDISSLFWREKIGNYGDSVFIIVPDQTLVSISCIASNNTCSFVGNFSGFIVGYNYFKSRLEA
jgi:hypothetical protein